MSRLITFGIFCMLFGLAVGFSLGVFGPEAAAPAAGENAGPPVVRSAECRRASGPIKIDGVLDEAAWEKAQVLKDFAVFWEHRPAKTATKARLLWDDDYLFFAAEMEDSDLYADVTQRNGMTWTNDVFELFFKPREKRLAYYEFQVNAANTQLELFLPSRGSGGYQRFAPLTKLGMESAVKLEGTLNDPTDKDKGWIVEGRIPTSAFLSSGDKPQPGAKWRFALCRYDYSVAFERVETSSTAPLTQPDFHRYEDYGELIFVGR
jgi:Carbohydrate family 9 binding domain-like